MNLLALFGGILFVAGYAYWVNIQERRQAEKREDELFQEGQKYYDKLQKEIHRCKTYMEIRACKSLIASFKDKFHNHPCYDKYLEMIRQSIHLKDKEIQNALIQ